MSCPSVTASTLIGRSSNQGKVRLVAPWPASVSELVWDTSLFTTESDHESAVRARQPRAPPRVLIGVLSGDSSGRHRPPPKLTRGHVGPAATGHPARARASR